MNFQDQTLTCKDCGKQFQFTASEQEFYQAKGFTNPPSRCADCRKAWKDKKKQQTGYMRGSGGEREMHEAVCSNCGNKCTVPFVPRGDRPVLCNDCYQKQRTERPERRAA